MMETAALRWLEQVQTQAFWISASLFISVNFLFAAAVFANRDRAFVNRWTSRLLTLDLLLVGTGVGVPVLAATARLAVDAMAPTLMQALPSFEAKAAAAGAEMPAR
jgi:hypothetical protein